MRKDRLKLSVLAAMFLAVGLLLPWITGHNPQINKMLLPMHIPVLLCGLLCGPFYGAAVGFILPLMRSAIFGFPELYPYAVSMAFEMGVYGFASGFIYSLFKNKNLAAIYTSLISAMILGRAAWGIAMGLLVGFGINKFNMDVFLSVAFVSAIPGIIIQIIIIPAIVTLAQKTSLSVNGSKVKNENK